MVDCFNTNFNESNLTSFSFMRNTPPPPKKAKSASTMHPAVRGATTLETPDKSLALRGFFSLNVPTPIV